MKRRKKQIYWRLVAGQFRKKRFAMVALVFVSLLLGIGLAAPFLAEKRPLYMVKEGQTYWFPNIIDYSVLRQVDFSTWVPAQGEYALYAPIPHAPERSNLREDRKSVV